MLFLPQFFQYYHLILCRWHKDNINYSKQLFIELLLCTKCGAKHVTCMTLLNLGWETP